MQRLDVHLRLAAESGSMGVSSELDGDDEDDEEQPRSARLVTHSAEWEHRLRQLILSA